MIRRPPRSTHCISSAASDVYKRQYLKSTLRVIEGNPKISIVIRMKSHAQTLQQSKPIVRLPTIKRKLLHLRESRDQHNVQNIPASSFSLLPQKRLQKWSRSFNLINEASKTPSGKRNHSRILCFPNIKTPSKESKLPTANATLHRNITYKLKSIVKRHRFLKFIQTSFYKYMESSPKEYRNSVINRSALKSVSYTHLRAHETGRNLVCRLLLEKKKKKNKNKW
eukprot:TRINITY_DN15498_c0_g1_i1.p1 TRINITY_DN15498_c0_g1~~TRINITY_DN15498_c0_g1_i1.p1  ORF type:complete len:231 (-),score=49.94 TRINITY_DN15498_c0_g1_i1:20-691(-)